MKLEIYLSKNSLSQSAFARDLSATSGQSENACAVIISKIINDNHIPRPDTVKHIFDLTGGIVKPNDFYDISARAQ